MARCGVCGSDVSALMAKKTADSLLCTSCADKVPLVMQKNISMYGAKSVASIAEYETEMRGKEFISTSSFGKLHLDEMNGLFAICEKSDGNGNLIGTADVFDCVYLENIGLYPIDPRQSKKDVVCDVELNCSYSYPPMRFKAKIKQNVKCEFKQINKTQATWSEPGELSMFRNMLDQTIKTSVKRAMEERDRVVGPYALDIMKARAALHVYEGCGRKLLDRQFQAMMNMYQNCGLPSAEIKGYTGLIKRYYEMLSLLEE